MHICYLGDINSIHLRRWVGEFLNKGDKIEIITFSQGNFKNAKVHCFPVNNINIKGGIKNWKYLYYVPAIRKLIKKIKPDILHSHYASSYGLIGALSDYHPLIISVWGSDVFDFPRRSLLHKRLLKYSLNKADIVCSTGRGMAEEIKKIINKQVFVTPFGVDTELFKPYKNKKSKSVTIGTVKNLEKIYNIDLLIKSFVELKERLKNKIDLRLLIVGSGSDEKRLKSICRKLKVEKYTTFTGRIEHKNIPSFLRKMDVYVLLSKMESFGVSILEAEACGIPVIVSDTVGANDVVINGKTGYIVNVENIDNVVSIIERLLLNKRLRECISKNAREFVIKNFNWKNSVVKMKKLYNSLLRN